MKKRMAVAGAAIGLMLPVWSSSVAQADPPPLPPAGNFNVTESVQGKTWQPYGWTLSSCGPDCLHVFSFSANVPWDMDMRWNQVQWEGNRLNQKGIACNFGSPEEHDTGPISQDYVIRPDLTGFININYSPEHPSCDGVTEMRTRQITLAPA